MKLKLHLPNLFESKREEESKQERLYRTYQVQQALHHCEAYTTDKEELMRCMMEYTGFTREEIEYYRAFV